MQLVKAPLQIVLLIGRMLELKVTFTGVEHKTLSEN